MAFDPGGNSRATETITVRGGTLTRRLDGTILATPGQHNMTLADARELITAIRRLAPPDKPVRMLLDERGLSRRVLPEARQYLQAESASFDRIGVLVGSTLSRFFATWMLSMTSTLGNKIKVFDDEASAYAWLHGDHE